MSRRMGAGGIHASQARTHKPQCHMSHARIKELVEICRHKSRMPRDPRSIDDVIQSFVPTALNARMEFHLHQLLQSSDAASGCSCLRGRRWTRRWRPWKNQI
jgi:hypothetical protein